MWVLCSEQTQAVDGAQMRTCEHLARHPADILTVTKKNFTVARETRRNLVPTHTAVTFPLVAPVSLSIYRSSGQNPNIHSSQLLEEMARSEEDNSGKEGRWTGEEHRKFVEAYQAVGRDWKRIQEAVGTRSLQQVRSHGQKYFLKLQRQRHASGAHSPRVVLQQQNALMRGYLQALANVNIAFFTELQKMQQCSNSTENSVSVRKEELS